MGIVQYVILHPWRVAITVVAGVLLGLGSFYVYQVQAALGTVASEEFNPQEARAAIDVTPTTSRDIVFVDPAPYPEGEELAEQQLELAGEFDLTGSFDPYVLTPNSFGEPIDDEVFTSYLLVGADASGFLADVIIFALQPEDGSDPIMVSLPRDLFVWNLCKRTLTRLNEGLGGCTGVASGSELLAIMVEDYTGIPVDHVARVNFAGFARIVDAMGGVTICVDHPTRDAKSHLDIASSGCRRANGELALAWVRSRHTEQLIGGAWVGVAGSDFARQNPTTGRALPIGRQGVGLLLARLADQQAVCGLRIGASRLVLDLRPGGFGGLALPGDQQGLGRPLLDRGPELPGARWGRGPASHRLLQRSAGGDLSRRLNRSLP